MAKLSTHLHLTFGIDILNLVVNRKSKLSHHKCNRILPTVSVSISCKLYGDFLNKILQIFKHIYIYCIYCIYIYIYIYIVTIIDPFKDWI